MTYFPDLSAYSYSPGGQDEGAVNVGWLDESHPFEEGSVDRSVVDSILRLCRGGAVRRTRGYHTCPFCKAKQFGMLVEVDGQRVVLGGAEIRVKGKAGRVYACPDLVGHYIKEHSYLPPAEFLEALQP